MSSLQYNGIALDMVRTLSITQEPQYSDDGVDYLWTKFQIHCQAVFNPVLTPAEMDDITPAQIMMRVRSGLLTPRRKLLFQVADGQGGKDTLIESPRGNHTQDDANGPKPLYANINRIDGSATFIVQYGIETHLNECYTDIQGQAGTPNGQPYVSNRWTETQTFDEHMFTHRYVTGKLVVRTEALMDPNSLRGIIYRQVPMGFERRNESYTVSSDNLQYSYSYHDVMVYKVTPAPAIRWQGTVLTANQEKSINAVTTEVIITMQGGAIYDPLGATPPTFSSKAQMLTQAAIIALGQLFPNQNPPFPAIPNSTNGMLVRAAVRNTLHEDNIELRLIAINQPFNQTMLGNLPLTANSKFMLGDLEHVKGVDAAPLPPNSPQGFQTDSNNPEKGMAFLKKVIDDPCLNLRVLAVEASSDEDEEEEQEEGEGESVARVYTGATSSTNLINPYDTYAGVYTYYSMTQKYDIDYHTYMLPLMSSYYAQSTSFPVVAPPTMTRIVRWEAERIGKPPTLPSPSLFDPANVLLHTFVEPQTPATMGDLSNPIWRLRGEYVYGLTGFGASGWAGTAGAFPFLTLTPDQTESWDFERGLIDNTLTRT